MTRVAVINRGEAAVRFIRAARTWSRRNRRPLSVVALYTTPEVGAPFVRMASSSVCLGEPLVRTESGELRSAYVDVQRVLDAAESAGADGIWPGWGFLAESPQLPEACAARGIVFLGPPASTMRLMGDKIASKRLAESEGVPVSPWSGGAVADPAEAAEHAERIGYPVVLKATAGGGGRGIRVVRSIEDLADAFRSAAAEAAAAFGDPALFVESFVPAARHVEVQILADGKGSVWALGTRDCSVQRRNQKLLEEAPAPDLAPEVERRLCAAGERLAIACDYQSAGTAEFLLLPDGESFYFLEMNTRLQVEHTVTEEIYGIDLVGAQIDIGLGLPLRAAGPPTPRGVSIQARLNAEDPDDRFAPRAGRLIRFSAPQGPGVRVDSGFSRGSTVPSAFDSNLAKIIARGEDRSQALARLETALRDTLVAIESGLTNRSLLLELVADSAFRDGPVTTRWLDGYLEARAEPAERRRLELALASAAIGDHVRTRRGQLANFLEEAQRGLPRSVPEPGGSELRYRLGNSPVALSVATLAPNRFRVRCGEWQAVVGAEGTGERTSILELDGRRHSVIRVATATDVHVDVDGSAHQLRRTSDGKVRASLPAAVSQIHVEVDQEVEAEALLVTLEVMKMEMAVESPLAGTVRSIHVRPAAQVAAGDLLLELEEPSGQDDTGDTADTDESGAVRPLRLAPRDEAQLDPLDVLQTRLLGFDIEADEASRAADALLDGEVSPRRSRLLRILRAYVIQEQLFKSGPFDDARNEAGESSLDQLAWFVHHRRLDDTRLSARYIRRLRRFLDLHQIGEVERNPQVDHALMRLFQARRSQRRLDGWMLAILRALTRSAPDHSPEMEKTVERVIFEKFASEALQRGQSMLATTAWELIYNWYDLPSHRALATRLQNQAGDELSALADPDAAPVARTRAREELSTMPLSTLLAEVPRTLAADRNRQRALLELLLESIYESNDQQAVDSLCDELTAGEIWVSGRPRVLGLLVPRPELPAELSQLPRDAELDLFLGFEPSADWPAMVSEALGYHPRVTYLWSSGEDTQHCRTFVHRDGAVHEETLVRDIHPTRPIAAEVERLGRFRLERVPAPPGIFAARGSAPGDERLFVIAEVQRFDPRVEGEFVSVPEFEKTFLDAVQVLRTQLQASTESPPQWNRITLILCQAVHLTRGQIQALVERLGASTVDLRLNKIVLRGRFTFGDVEASQEFSVEWSPGVGQAARVEFQPVRHRPLDVLSTYEQKVMAARRRRLFYPYEVIRWLNTQGGDELCGQGRFEELDLDGSGEALTPVGERPHGENQANVVVGLITNPSRRFPEGMTRVLVAGDPTRTMGSLGEPECRRILAAIDHAEQARLPVEWLALSSGAKIAFDSGTENLDWTAAVLRRIIEFTERGGVINILVDGGCVGAQSYWNAEATMMNHCRGTLVMTPRGYMVLTGKRALEYAGSIAGPTNEAIGGLDIMEPNGQAQYTAPGLHEAYDLLFRHYDLTYVAPDEGYTRRLAPADPVERDVAEHHYTGGGFDRIGAIFAEPTNPGRKKPFDIRQVMTAVLDGDVAPIERWERLVGGETSVVFHGQLGGQPVCMIGIESTPVPRKGRRPVDGPASWLSGTLFPQSSRKVARAVHAASGVQPVVVLANLSGFDGSPESLRERQLEYGAEIGRAVVKFQGPIVFCVIARYHGGAYVVFSQRLNEGLETLALEGTYASVIGGAPAAAVVFPGLVRKRTAADPRVAEARRLLEQAAAGERTRLRESYEETYGAVEAEVQAAVAGEFDAEHSVERARKVGSLSAILAPSDLRSALCERVRAGVQAYRR